VRLAAPLQAAIKRAVADRLGIRAAASPPPPRRARSSSTVNEDRRRLADALARWYRDAALRWHPDRGGSDVAMAVVNNVKDELASLLLG
jgi:hypothetical protein